MVVLWWWERIWFSIGRKFNSQANTTAARVYAHKENVNLLTFIYLCNCIWCTYDIIMRMVIIIIIIMFSPRACSISRHSRYLVFNLYEIICYVYGVVCVRRDALLPWCICRAERIARDTIYGLKSNTAAGLGHAFLELSGAVSCCVGSIIAYTFIMVQKNWHFSKLINKMQFCNFCSILERIGRKWEQLCMYGRKIGHRFIVYFILRMMMWKWRVVNRYVCIAYIQTLHLCVCVNMYTTNRFSLCYR